MLSRPKRKKANKFILIVSQRLDDALTNEIDNGPYEVMMGQATYLKPLMAIDDEELTPAQENFLNVIDGITHTLDPENNLDVTPEDLAQMPVDIQAAIENL